MIPFQQNSCHQCFSWILVAFQLEFAINWSEILDEDRIVLNNVYSFLLVVELWQWYNSINSMTINDSMILVQVKFVCKVCLLRILIEWLKVNQYVFSLFLFFLLKYTHWKVELAIFKDNPIWWSDSHQVVQVAEQSNYRVWENIIQMMNQLHSLEGDLMAATWLITINQSRREWEMILTIQQLRNGSLTDCRPALG